MANHHIRINLSSFEVSELKAHEGEIVFSNHPVNPDKPHCIKLPNGTTLCATQDAEGFLVLRVNE
jgi:hypothetical protein